jgi:hypothetical protein
MEIILIAISLFLGGYNLVETKCERKKEIVLKIGVCDSRGWCRVVTDKGITKSTMLPMEGEEITYLDCK